MRFLFAAALSVLGAILVEGDTGGHSHLRPDLIQCGGWAINPDYQLCCDEKIYWKGNKYADYYRPIYGDRYRQYNDSCCCDKPYDSNNRVCCGGEISKRPPVGRTQCCGTKTIDACTNFCCDEQSHSYKEHKCTKRCCGDCGALYDIRTQCCCGNAIYPMPSSGYCNCCGDVAYSFYQHRCCGTTLYKYPLPYRHGCCGDKLINYNTQRCCYAGNGAWNVYEIKTQQCCEGVVVKKRPNAEACCQKTTYNPAKEVCCAKGPVPISLKKINACCVNKPYYTGTHLCCEGNLIKKIHLQYTKCCGEGVIHSLRDVCCHHHDIHIGGLFKPTEKEANVMRSEKDENEAAAKPPPEVTTPMDCKDPKTRQEDMNGLGVEGNSECAPLGQNGEAPEAARQKRDKKAAVSPFVNPYSWFTQHNRRCCGETEYSPHDYVCCGGCLKPREYGYHTGCCGNTIYNWYSEICCCGRIYPKTTLTDKDRKSTRCCGCKPYDPVRDICCCGNRVFPRRYDKNTRCCDRSIFDMSRQWCCCGQVYTQPKTPFNACCGGTPYNYNQRLCCRPSLVLCVKPNQLCCAGKCYNKASQKCCYGKIYPSTVSCISPFFFHLEKPEEAKEVARKVLASDSKAAQAELAP